MIYREGLGQLLCSVWIEIYSMEYSFLGREWSVWLRSKPSSY